MRSTLKKSVAVLLCILLSAMALSGCQKKEEPLKGKYYYEAPDGTVYTEQYLEFSPDGKADTLVMKNREGETFLHYELDGDEIVLELVSLVANETERLPFKRSGNVVWMGGMKFVKQ